MLEKHFRQIKFSTVYLSREMFHDSGSTLSHQMFKELRTSRIYGKKKKVTYRNTLMG
jgi:hypothetical protein